MIETLFGLDQASTYAVSNDWLITLITIVVGFWWVLTEGVLFWLIFRFRRKDGVKAQYIGGDKKSEKKWITVPHALILVCDVVLIAGAIMVWVEVKQSLPEAERTVRVTARQWAWVFDHPGPDGKLDTADDISKVDELHIQKDTVYHFLLESADVVHSFSVPVFRLKQDAVPGREITGWFKATKEGRFDIQCAEMCGIGHGLMPADLYIEDEAGHKAWLAGGGVASAEPAPTPAPADPAPAPADPEPAATNAPAPEATDPEPSATNAPPKTTPEN